MSKGVVIIDKQVWIDGEKLPEVPSKKQKCNQTVINKKVYIDGCE